MQALQNISLEEIVQMQQIPCTCGRIHQTSLKELVVRPGACREIPALVKKYKGSRVFVLADKNTYGAAGEAVCAVLQEMQIPYSLYVYPQDHLETDEWTVGQAIMHFDHHCDFVISVGSGTLNDIGKIVARTTKLPYMIVGTAPSMDGFASATSSAIRDGVKITLDSMCPTIIVADTEIVAKAPLKLLQAGIGDMLAKYISICEWRISHVVNGEYYCEQVAALVRASLQKCVSSNLLHRNPDDVKSVLEGLILSGMAMSFVGMSRPASGMEHYFSHIWDMRGLELKAPIELHGLQCGIGTLLALKIYRFLIQTTPNREKAIKFVNNFSVKDWHEHLQSFLGNSAQELIRLESKEGKYDLRAHQKRLDKIISHWDEIRRIIADELPSLEEVEVLLSNLGAPITPEAIGHTPSEVRQTFLTTKDIRNKYIGSHLLWDLGLINDAAECL